MLSKIWNWINLNVSFDISWKEEYPTIWIEIGKIGFQVNFYIKCK
jgi:hypothetical protein